MFLYPRVYVRMSHIQTADIGCGITWLFPYYMFPRTSKDIFLTEILVYCACLHILYIIHAYIDNFIPCSVSHMHTCWPPCTHSSRSNGGRDHSSNYRQHKPVMQGDGAIRVTSECALTCVCLRHLHMSPLLLCCMSMHKVGWAVIPNMPPPRKLAPPGTKTETKLVPPGTNLVAEIALPCLFWFPLSIIVNGSTTVVV